MKKYIVLFIVLLIAQMSFGQLTVSWPIDRAVFQRDNSGNANVIIAGQSFAAPFPSNWQIQYQIRYLNKFGTETATQTNWTAFPTPGVGKVFRVSVNIPTGWYRLNVRIMQNGTSQITSSTLKFGVGEVFVIAGQSNSVGEGSVSYSSASPSSTYDCIISSSQTSANKCTGNLPKYPVFGALNPTASAISPNADQPWAYNILGTKIVDMTQNLVVPVMFFNTGLSGTTSDDWSFTADNPTISRSTNFGNDRCSQGGGNGVGAGEPYRALRNSLNYYASLFGIRGVIWHQGETDNNSIVTSTIYTTNLNNVIEKSRMHFNSDLAWAVSNVSYNNGTTSLAVITGQGDSRSQKAAVLGANNSDILTLATGHRQNDNTHFNYTGLSDLSTQYFNNISSLLAKTPIPSNQIVPVLITQVNSNTKQVAINFGAMGKSSTDFNCYFWTQGDDYTIATYPVGNCNSSYTAKLVTTNGTWRCYMRDAKGNVFTTQRIFINTSSSFRVAQNVLNSSVYPNPTYVGFENTIAFKVETPSIVKLELVDEAGTLIQTITNSLHDIGDFKYPFTLKNKAFKVYETVYYRLTIGDISETKKIILE